MVLLDQLFWDNFFLSKSLWESKSFKNSYRRVQTANDDTGWKSEKVRPQLIFEIST